jgi:hypothetical protein
MGLVVKPDNIAQLLFWWDFYLSRVDKLEQINLRGGSIDGEQ